MSLSILNTANLSSLEKTWIFDLDGTLVKHNGYIHGGDKILPGVKKFFEERILPGDYIIILTARCSSYKKQTEAFLKDNGIRYNTILYDLPHGERLLFNDKKPLENLKTAYSVNVERDSGL